MSTRPNPAVSQPDRDALDDIGLAYVLERTDDPDAAVSRRRDAIVRHKWRGRPVAHHTTRTALTHKHSTERSTRATLPPLADKRAGAR